MVSGHEVINSESGFATVSAIQGKFKFFVILFQYRKNLHSRFLICKLLDCRFAHSRANIRRNLVVPYLELLLTDRGGALANIFSGLLQQISLIVSSISAGIFDESNRLPQNRMWILIYPKVYIECKNN